MFSVAAFSWVFFDLLDNAGKFEIFLAKKEMEEGKIFGFWSLLAKTFPSNKNRTQYFPACKRFQKATFHNSPHLQKLWNMSNKLTTECERIHVPLTSMFA